MEFWTNSHQLNSQGKPTLELAGGENQRNAWKWVVAGTAPGNQIYLQHRHAIDILGDTIRFSFRYKITDITTLGTNVRWTCSLGGLRHESGSLPKVYLLKSGSLPSQGVDVDTLTTSGAWATVTFTFTSIFTDSYLSDCDFFYPFIGITAPESSDAFSFWVTRCRMVQA
jgi:hypothetical protein